MRRIWGSPRVGRRLRSYRRLDRRKLDPLGTLAADGMAYFTRARVVCRKVVERDRQTDRECAFGRNSRMPSRAIIGADADTMHLKLRLLSICSSACKDDDR